MQKAALTNDAYHLAGLVVIDTNIYLRGLIKALRSAYECVIKSYKGRS